ncbi:Flp pilus assembly protein CpaB [Jannaschia donghaensis]|uniref:Flp pilus assembly protein CpaB n=1 Tax=Jannaschia donghaensis TaxID=420998 RepID=A0A0M6YKB5_9RHOB|nr:Flp pilus assembly protein CpaB [Jannaschia donghaensis]CTQ49963.1 Flp pilus assembly protein CpaB [Jannaschia donghaensis]
MRLIFGLLLLVGLGLAGFAINTAKGRFDQYQNALNQSQSAIVPVRDVYVVKRQLRYGDILRPDDVRAVSWPEDAVPAGTFDTLDAIFPTDDDGQRTVLRVMERDEPILLTKVTQPGQEAGLAAALTKGMRAFTLQVDVNSGVSGFLRPGDRVDVYWTGGSSTGGVTRLIHANLPLIAIDQQTDEERNSPTIARNITVEVTPAEVAKLAQAQATGRLTLALVGVRDDTQSPTVEATLAEILGPKEQAPVVERQETCSVRTRKGGEVARIQIPCPQDG